jgi:hypothetical protein
MGHALGAGVYWVNLAFEGERRNRRIALLR